MLAEIITIGDEILIGQVVDTNSAWLARQLNTIGIRVIQISSISDDKMHILTALKEAAGRAEIILITGGLGPTKDDITKYTLAEYFGVRMREDEAALANVINIFDGLNKPLLDINKNQAAVPENCETILNEKGTAPGMWFNSGGKVYVSMPGVPFEMMYMVENTVLPKLQASFNLPVIIHRTLLTAGEGESFLAKRIEDIENDLPKGLKLAYLPKLGQVRLRLSGYDTDKVLLQESLDKYFKKLCDRLADVLIADNDIPLEKAVLDALISNKKTLSIAESCTGGYLASLFTQHAGASKAFLGGVIVYSNELKKSVLGVKEVTLDDFGAVSEQTVTEMVDGALLHFKSDFAIAVTGVAGPGGGTEEKPVGTVWIGAKSGTDSIIKKFTFSGNRAQIVERASVRALIMLNTLIKRNQH